MKYIVVHCSDSPQGRGDNAAVIHRWHQERGFDGIGYHAVILESGKIEPGRPEYWKGAHVGGHNKDTLGICLIGLGGDATEAQLVALEQLVKGWVHKYPDAEVVGHRDLDPRKTCPGFDVKQWRKSL